MKNIKSFSAVLGTADTPNANGRVYPKAVFDKAIEDFKKDNRPVLGYFPTEPGNLPYLGDAAILCQRLTLRDTDLVAKIHVLDTPKGKILKDILGVGGEILITMSGIGKVTNGVVTEYSLEYLTISPVNPQ